MPALLLCSLLLCLGFAASGGVGSVRPLGEVARFGVYTSGLPYSTVALERLEARVGVKMEIASGFVDFDYVLGGPRDLALADRGRRTLLYSWEPQCQDAGRCLGFADLIAGRADAYLARVAESMRAFPYAIYVRPWAELNAYWSAYQPGSGRPGAGSVDEYKRAWRYLHDFFRSRGVKNLKLVWNPDVSDDPRNVPLRELWPGRDYVDALGLDGYNWGESGTPDGHTWLEFDQIFAAAYRTVTELDPDVPVWICEFGSKEPAEDDGTAKSPAPADPAHDKASWLEHMLRSTAFPRITALAYYSSYAPGWDNERDFRLDSSEAALAVIRKHLRARGASRK